MASSPIEGWGRVSPPPLKSERETRRRSSLPSLDPRPSPLSSPSITGGYRLLRNYCCSPVTGQFRVETMESLKAYQGFNQNLYPPIEPYSSGFLRVSDLHTLNWEQSGNPSGHDEGSRFPSRVPQGGYGAYNAHISAATRCAALGAPTLYDHPASSYGRRFYGPSRGMGKKIFVGRLPQEASIDDLRQYFGRFGRILDVYILKDHKRSGHWGFGFVTFAEDGVTERVSRRTHEILGQEICVMLCADHGPYVSSAHNIIVTTRAGTDLVFSIVSGLLTIGPRFGGAIDDAARYFKDACDKGLTPYEFVESMKKKGIREPGIGHR